MIKITVVEREPEEFTEARSYEYFCRSEEEATLLALIFEPYIQRDQNGLDLVIERESDSDPA